MMTFIKHGNLKDEEIIAALHQAVEDYKNGELAKVRETLTDICVAIDESEAF